MFAVAAVEENEIQRIEKAILLLPPGNPGQNSYVLAAKMFKIAHVAGQYLVIGVADAPGALAVSKQDSKLAPFFGQEDRFSLVGSTMTFRVS